MFENVSTANTTMEQVQQKMVLQGTSNKSRVWLGCPLFPTKITCVIKEIQIPRQKLENVQNIWTTRIWFQYYMHTKGKILHMFQPYIGNQQANGNEVTYELGANI